MSDDTEVRQLASQRRALLIDFDGTLVNTNPLHLAAYNHVLADYGVQITAAEYLANLGGGGVKVIGRICQQRSWNLPAETIVRSKAAHYLSRLPDAVIDLQPTLAALIRQRDKRVVIVTDSAYPQVALALECLQLNSCIDDVVWPEGGTPGKPSPDLYLKALAIAGCDRGDCLAFEDTVTGELAARAAGLDCIRKSWFE